MSNYTEADGKFWCVGEVHRWTAGDGSSNALPQGDGMMDVPCARCPCVASRGLDGRWSWPVTPAHIRQAERAAALEGAKVPGLVVKLENSERRLAAEREASAAFQSEVSALQSRVAQLTAERDGIGAKLAMVSDAMETVRKAAHAPKGVILAEAVSVMRSERDALRAQVAAARQWAEKNMERVVVYPEHLLKKMDEAAALSAPPAKTTPVPEPHVCRFQPWYDGTDYCECGKKRE